VLCHNKSVATSDEGLELVDRLFWLRTGLAGSAQPYPRMLTIPGAKRVNQVGLLCRIVFLRVCGYPRYLRGFPRYRVEKDLEVLVALPFLQGVWHRRFRGGGRWRVCV